MKNIKCVLMCTALMFVACTDDDRTISTLKASGFTGISVGGYGAFDCGKDDTYATKFTAMNPQGMVVSGTVCCGFWKSCTVRF